jgi:ATP-dependent DNA helicase HFM1/MER3
MQMSNFRICTPEKLDNLTRRWKEVEQILKDIGILLVDEIHTLNENRGACLEGLLTRYASFSPKSF